MKLYSRTAVQRQSRSNSTEVALGASTNNPRLTAIGMACLLLTLSAAQAAPFSILQRPPGRAGVPPAPNIIISVDDSGSMDWEVSPGGQSKLVLLKAALKAQFGDGTANSGKIADKSIRLAWQSMWGTNTLVPGATNAMRSFEGTHRTNFNKFIDDIAAGGGTPSLRVARRAHDYMRSAEGIDSPWADSPGTTQTTPYLACRRSYHVFLTDGAWNSVVNADKGLAGDSTDQTLPDGTAYSTAAATKETRIYRDAFGDQNPANASSFSDLAFRSWATDLQDGTGGTSNMSNVVAPLIKRPGNEIFATTACTTAGNCFATPQYWNPQNDPATWQHLNTYTIGFGLGAVNWPNTATTPVDWDSNTVPNPTRDNYGGDFAKVVQGAKVWPDVQTEDVNGTPDIRTIELWHGALNGRGKYFPAKTVNDLEKAFEDILNTAISDSAQSLVSVATSSSFLRAGSSAFVAGYNPNQWSGEIKARAIDLYTGNVSTTDAWNAASLLDHSTYSVANRFVLSSNNGTGFSWKTYSGTAPILPAAQQTPMNKNSAGTVDDKGQDRVDYIRGDRTKEVQNGGSFRDRSSRLGDVVNSNIWYVGVPASGYTINNYASFRSSTSPGKGGRTPMVYIGANDGMLHGFAASTNGSVAAGTELLAYIPQGIAEGKLRKLTDPAYNTNHEYFVDGSPFSGDAYLTPSSGTAAWSTILVGTLGRGGKGYFVLDATDPANFTTSNAGSLVIKDTTASTDADIGVMPSPPSVDPSIASKSGQIVQMNNGRWALVMGNGYNSTNEAPVLLVQYLDGDKSIVKISPCGGQTVETSGCAFQGGGNGLSTPVLIDLNGNGKVDVAYAGDLQGNLWKFNLTSATPASWDLSFERKPFFIAKGPTSLGARTTGSVVQPITTAPYWAPHPLGGIQIGVGTGKMLTVADQTSNSIASHYGLWDNSTFTVASGIVTINESTSVTSPVNTPDAVVSMSRLVQQTMNPTAVMDSGGTFFKSTSNTVAYTTSDAGTSTAPVIAATKRGWFLDYALSGQRVLSNTRPFFGQNIVIQSTIPSQGATSSTETCSANPVDERNFLSILNILTGATSNPSPFTLATPDTAVSTFEVGTDVALLQIGKNTTRLIKTTNTLPANDPICVSNPNDRRCPTNLKSGAPLGKRASWRNEQ